MFKPQSSPRLALAALALLAATATSLADGQTAKLLAGDGMALDQFGSALAINGGAAIVGAPGHDAVAVGSGAAYLFDTTSGAELIELLPTDGAPSQQFGSSVAISATTVVVGAVGDADNGVVAGAAYLFDRATGVQLAKLLPTDGAANARFGSAVAISGTTVVVGAVSASVGGLDTGSAYVFDALTGMQLAKLVASDGGSDDGFGGAVAVRGSVALVGALRDDDGGIDSGSAYLFDTSTGAQLAKLVAASPVAGDALGAAVALGDTTAVVGAPSGSGPGRVLLFDLATGNQGVALLASDPLAVAKFGGAVGIDAATIIVGARSGPNLAGVRTGSAYVFDAVTGTERAKLLASDGVGSEAFGVAVAVSGTTVVVGANLDNAPAFFSGSAYLFSTAAQSYCTAGTSAGGCQATLSASGTSSASAASGFVLLATSVEGSKDGLFFFGTAGRQAGAWGNGTSLQCVVPPVSRAGLLVGAGTGGACDGSFTQDLNARWAARPAQNPGAGAIVQAQLWYRDPANTSNRTTSLSDAIEFCVAP